MKKIILFVTILLMTGTAIGSRTAECTKRDVTPQEAFCCGTTATSSSWQLTECDASKRQTTCDLLVISKALGFIGYQCPRAP